jgi:hypothetical protein
MSLRVLLPHPRTRVGTVEVLVRRPQVRLRRKAQDFRSALARAIGSFGRLVEIQGPRLRHLRAHAFRAGGGADAVLGCERYPVLVLSRIAHELESAESQSAPAHDVMEDRGRTAVVRDELPRAADARSPFLQLLLVQFSDPLRIGCFRAPICEQVSAARFRPLAKRASFFTWQFRHL